MKLLYFTVVLFLAKGVSAQKAEIFQKDGSAIRGYDPVSFFTQGQALKGDENYSYQWNGARWLFSSSSNLESFKGDPGKYAPQYGGYCAYGMAEGHKAPTEPSTWTILDGKLYFNYNLKVKELWVRDTKGFIEKADHNWPQLKNKE
ncbi:MAG TPA: YHS domain-containing (seleno)protein [Chitinophagaceae bacterium]|nr:YHS domain-containing (seleno)protein [Chitinophagaceae bacterium]